MTFLAKLRGIIAGLNGNLLNGFNTGLNALVVLAMSAVGRVLPFDADRLRGGRHSINPELVIVSETRPGHQVQNLQRISDIS